MVASVRYVVGKYKRKGDPMTATKELPAKATRERIDPKEAARLLEEAMKQPGVKDLMDAYGEAKRYADAAAEYHALTATRSVEWASDSSS